jgi:hypothetical protein
MNGEKMNEPHSISASSQITASQAAYHYRANLVPIPQPFLIAPKYQAACPLERLESGLIALHAFMATLYQAGVSTPQVLVPPELTHRKQTQADACFTTFPRLLFALGVYGQLVEVSGKIEIEVEPGALANFCLLAKIKAYEPFLKLLEPFGLVFLPSQPLLFRFPAEPDMLQGLVVFAHACRQLTNKVVNPPVEFLRVDYRLLQINRNKIKSVPIDTDEAIKTLVDEKEAGFARKLDTWARSENYTANVRCTSVRLSEFIAKYCQAKTQRVLFGLHTETGRLKMHLNFNQTSRILPYIAQTPVSFRQLYYQKCTCADCGGCEEGPLQIELDEQIRRLCHFSYLSIPEVYAGHYEAIQFMLKAQAEILREDK